MCERANFTKANLSRANLGGAALEHALLIQTNLEGANLESCTVYDAVHGLILSAHHREPAAFRANGKDVDAVGEVNNSGETGIHRTWSSQRDQGHSSGETPSHGVSP